MQRYKIIFFLMLLTLFSILIHGVSAQVIDIENMDKEQLEELLQAIQNKLEKLESETEEEQNGENMGSSFFSKAMSSSGKKNLSPVSDPKKFQIYTNKKINVDKLPDSMFIRKKPGEDGDDGTGSSGGKMDSGSCEEHCAYEVCPWGDNQCYFRCYYSCTGEPIPEDLRPHL